MRTLVTVSCATVFSYHDTRFRQGSQSLSRPAPSSYAQIKGVRTEWRLNFRKFFTASVFCSQLGPVSPAATVVSPVLEVSPPGATTSTGGRPWRSNRVNRGGSWNNSSRNCRCANRNRNEPGNRNNNLDFRLAAAQPVRWMPRRLNRPFSDPVRQFVVAGEISLGPPGAGSKTSNAPGGFLSLRPEEKERDPRGVHSVQRITQISI